MKKILLIGVISLLSMNSFSAGPMTKIVTGTGSANCPAGYVMSGIIPIPETSDGVLLGFAGCSSVSATGVSGCRSMVAYWSKNFTAKISIICAKSCGN